MLDTIKERKYFNQKIISLMESQNNISDFIVPVYASDDGEETYGTGIIIDEIFLVPGSLVKNKDFIYFYHNQEKYTLVPSDAIYIETPTCMFSSKEADICVFIVDNLHNSLVFSGWDGDPSPILDCIYYRHEIEEFDFCVLGPFYEEKNVAVVTHGNIIDEIDNYLAVEIDEIEPIESKGAILMKGNKVYGILYSRICGSDNHYYFLSSSAIRDFCKYNHVFDILYLSTLTDPEEIDRYLATDHRFD